MENEDQKIEKKQDSWFKKHVDTVIVLGGILTAVLWMNHTTNSLRTELHENFARIEKDITMIKTVLIMKNIMPCEMAKKSEN